MINNDENEWTGNDYNQDYYEKMQQFIEKMLPIFEKNRSKQAAQSYNWMKVEVESVKIAMVIKEI